MRAVITKIVNGLFLKCSGQRLPVDHEVRDYVLNPKLREQAQEEILKLQLFKVGDGSVFNYRYAIDVTKSESVWFLMFYNDSVLFVTNTGGRDRVTP